MPLIIYQYIAKTFLKYVLIIFAISAGLILLFDIIELLRVAVRVQHLALRQIFFMAFMKNYCHFHKIWPFIILLSTIFTYRKLSSEFALYVLRSAGFSTLQLLLPVLFVSFTIGVLHMTTLNPLGAKLLARYQHMEAIHIHGAKSLINLSHSGLWLKQNDDAPMIIHALRISQPENTLFDCTIFYFDSSHTFIKRLSAKSIRIKENAWTANIVSIMDSNYKLSTAKSMELPINVTFKQITDGMINPEIMSFWALYSFLNSEQDAGIVVMRHISYFWNLLMSPLLFTATALMGYIFGTSMPRFHKAEALLAAAITIEFILYFLSSFLNALMLAGSMSIILSISMPILAHFVIGLYSILHYEFANYKK